jgi:hypothetical protein
MSEHVPQQCGVKDCEQEASYWIDTEGFVEPMIESAPETFYLCTDHQYELEGKDEQDGGYVHLRVDTGEIRWFEIGKYCCSEECDICCEP